MSHPMRILRKAGSANLRRALSLRGTIGGQEVLARRLRCDVALQPNVKGPGQRCWQHSDRTD